jgi:hypothetical protein
MPNLQGLITNLLNFPALSRYLDFVRGAIVVGGIAFAVYRWRPLDDIDSRLSKAGFSLSVVMVLLTSYYFSGYDLALLILPLLVVGNSFTRPSEVKPGWSRIFLVCMGTLLFVPAYWVLMFPIRRPYWAPLVLLGLAASISSRMNPLRAGNRASQEAIAESPTK